MIIREWLEPLIPGGNRRWSKPRGLPTDLVKSRVLYTSCKTDTGERDECALQLYEDGRSIVFTYAEYLRIKQAFEEGK